MRILKYAFNILTGRIGHWNKINTATIKHFGTEIEKLEGPPKIFFEHFFASTSSVIDFILEPRGKFSEEVPSLQIDVKNINLNQIINAYCVVLSFCVFEYYSIHPPLEAGLKGFLLIITKESEIATQFLNKVDKQWRNLPKAERHKPPNLRGC